MLPLSAVYGTVAPFSSTLGLVATSFLYNTSLSDDGLLQPVLARRQCSVGASAPDGLVESHPPRSIMVKTMPATTRRRSPEELLQQAQAEEEYEQRGKLKVFLGYAS